MQAHGLNYGRAPNTMKEDHLIHHEATQIYLAYFPFRLGPPKSSPIPNLLNKHGR